MCVFCVIVMFGHVLRNMFILFFLLCLLRGEQEAICNLEKLIAFSSALTSSLQPYPPNLLPFLQRKLGSDQLFTVDISTTFFLGEALRPPPNPLPLF